jgi:nucleoside-diphosphate-sugar epimerase
LLRVAGIYGPGRLPVDRVRAGEALRVAWPEVRYSNAIHVDDLVELILAALGRGRPNRVYNACDGVAHRQGALLEAVAAELGVALPSPLTPEAAERELSPVRLSFLAESRRCRGDRARTELGWRPRYTDLADGVRASLATGE